MAQPVEDKQAVDRDNWIYDQNELRVGTAKVPTRKSFAGMSITLLPLEILSDSERIGA
jgi:hypothetical protein